MVDSKGFHFDRRGVMQAVAAGTATAALAQSGMASGQAGTRRRYAIVGTGSRARMFQDAIWGPHKATAQLVAVCDPNIGRLAYVGRRAAKVGTTPPKSYLASDFAKMIRAERPHALIVTTPDVAHDDYIVAALDAGVDVITEKPMTIDAPSTQRILDATRRTNRHPRVTFNYRYAPYRTQVKELLMAGEIGDIMSVDFHWLLNTVHGADYFRRWHSNKAISGGLMVHKSTHHFDLVNWWLSDMPATVSASGKREFYTPNMARRMGLQGPHERCLTCPEKQECTFYFDLAEEKELKELYLDNEKYDGYHRDQCVWRPEINIEDTMNVIVGYEGGATLSYSLNAFNAWEGYEIAFNGTKGRLEHTVVESAFIAGASGNKEEDRVTTRIIPLRGTPRTIEPRMGEGGHGGGDAVMLADLFDPNAPADPLLRAADERGGAASILVGIAANRSFETGNQVRINDLVSGLQRPDYPAMPTRSTPLPMPPSTQQV